MTTTTTVWVHNVLPDGDGDVWDADTLLTELVEHRHPHLQPGDRDTEIVRCPDCGQMEVWTIDELADHGRCRSTDRPCVCDETVDDLPRLEVAGVIDLRSVPDDIYHLVVDAVKELLDDNGYVVTHQYNELGVWRPVG